jgi:hypothetical protein
MHRPSPSSSPRLRSPRPPRAVAWPGLALAACALLAAGCEEERHDAFSKRPETRAPGLVGVDTSGGFDAERPGPAPAAKPKPAPPAKKEPQPILGKRTQDIKDANAELKSGQARQASTRIVAKDPITIQGNAYVSIIGQTSILNIQHAVDLYRATNDRYPKDLDEFMNEIIKPNNIALPKLPYYQEYGYDAAQHKLIILEYPDRK